MDARTYLFLLVPVGLTLLLTPLVRAIALRLHILDNPERDPQRKSHIIPIPLMGGLAVFVSFGLSVLAVLLVAPDVLLGGYLLPKHIVGILLGGFVLMLGGVLDDRKPRGPAFQIVWPVVAALVVIASGIGIEYLSNPFGEPIRLDQWSILLLTIGDTPYHIVVLADLFAFLWLMVAMYTTKFLDGLDGLVAGITTIGMLILFGLSMSTSVGQPETALLALLAAAAFLPFLIFNFNPARIFLGEGGSLLAGFLLGTFAILSGAKIATALLILGIPLLDLLWVIARRMFAEHRPITMADRKHLHFRLLDAGLSHRQAVLVLYLFTAVFGSATLFVEGKAKVLALAGLGVVMVIFGAVVVLRVRRRQRVDTAQSRGYTGRTNQ